MIELVDILLAVVLIVGVIAWIALNVRVEI